VSDGIVRAVPKTYRAPRPRKGLAARNPDRASAKFADAFLSKEYVEFIHSLGCCTPGCRKIDIEAAHVGPTRANGGKWYEIAPLCSAHHREQEGATEKFNAKHGVDLVDIAAATALRWKERTKPLPEVGSPQEEAAQ
jgi:hypothetical protein